MYTVMHHALCTLRMRVCHCTPLLYSLCRGCRGHTHLTTALRVATRYGRPVAGCTPPQTSSAHHCGYIHVLGVTCYRLWLLITPMRPHPLPACDWNQQPQIRHCGASATQQDAIPSVLLDEHVSTCNCCHYDKHSVLHHV